MAKIVTESEFYMWRTLFAIAHADGHVTEEEVRFMAEAMEDVPFSLPQAEILKQDMRTPKDIIEMFTGVTDALDQARFFKFARELVWADGVYAHEEQNILLKLQQAHINSVNVDDLIGRIEMEFAPEDPPVKDSGQRNRKRSPRDIIFSFRQHFLNARKSH